MSRQRRMTKWVAAGTFLSVGAWGCDGRYFNIDVLASGRYHSFISDKFRQCRATTYAYVDRLVHDFAAGIWPELFEDWEPDCFAPPAP